jgi:hypothetical protein
VTIWSREKRRDHATQYKGNAMTEAELTAAMKATFGADQRRIDHALAVLGYARRIMRAAGGQHDPPSVAQHGQGVVDPPLIAAEGGLHGRCQIRFRHGIALVLGGMITPLFA